MMRGLLSATIIMASVAGGLSEPRADPKSHEAPEQAPPRLPAATNEALRTDERGSPKGPYAPSPDSMAINAEGPWRILSSGSQTVHMIAGPPPKNISDATVERWLWTFRKEPRVVNKDRFDSNAVLFRVDCGTSTSQSLRMELFLDRRLYKALTEPSSPTKHDRKGTVGHAFVQAACDPDYGKTSRSFIDLTAASNAANASLSRVVPATSKDKAPQKTPAAAQDADRTRLPIRLTDNAGAQSTMVILMTEGPAPKSTPEGPVDVWEWRFWGAPFTVAGETLFDAIATLQRVDCSAETTKELMSEVYADGRFRRTRKPSEPATPKKSLKHLLDAACDPSYKPDAPTFPDHRAARAEAVKIIAARKKEMARRRNANATTVDTSQTIARDHASSGEAERVGGPLRMIGLSSETRSFFMAANTAPTVRPTTPTEVWIWTFAQKPRLVDRKAKYDTWATRFRVDCKARTVRSQLREVYRDGVLDNSWEYTSKARKVAKGSLDEVALSAVCDPAYMPGAQRFKDHHAARKAVLNTRLKSQPKREQR